MLAAKHFDPVMGVDIHIVTIPPAGPVPIPHPHISSVLDPMDYVPIMGGTVLIGGVPRGTAGTAGTTIPHIPLGGPFVKPAGNEDEIFMGSATVLADGAPFTFTALPALSCQDVGMPAPMRAKKPKKSYGMLLPTSSVITIPAGLPVMVGGPPTVDMMGLAMSGAFAALGALAKKLRGLQKGSKRIKAISDAIHDKARKLMDKMGIPPNIRNKVHKGICSVTGHPVDVVTGKVFTTQVDLELEGEIPFVFERTWNSTSSYQGPLGTGWHHNFDVVLLRSERAVAVRLSDGRAVTFPSLKPGEESFNRQERLILRRDDEGYRLQDTEGLLYCFTNTSGEEELLDAVTDLSGDNRIRFFYDDRGLLKKVVDSCQRLLWFEHDDQGRLVKIMVPSPDGSDEYYCAMAYHYRNNNLVSAVDALGGRQEYAYSHNLLIRETDKNGFSFYFEYDAETPEARCVRTWGDGGLYDHQLRYDDARNITYVKNSLGHITTYYHNGVLPEKIKDPTGNSTLYEYNAHYDLVKETDPNGFVSEYHYDDHGNVTEVIEADGSTRLMSYDSNANIVAMQDSVDGQWQWHYDDNGRLLRKTDSLNRSTYYRYHQGLLVEIRYPGEQCFRFGYDQHRQLASLSHNGQLRSKWIRDLHGRVTSQMDCLRAEAHYKYDALGRVTHIKMEDGEFRFYRYDPEGNILQTQTEHSSVNYEYCGMGRIAARTQSGVTLRFEYDTEEQLTGVVNPDGNRYRLELDSAGQLISETGFDGRVRRYERDKAGRLLRYLRPSGGTSRYHYSESNRLKKIEHSDGGFTELEYRADGCLMKAVNTSTRVVFERDLLGNLLSAQQGEHRIDYQHSSEGTLTGLTSSLGADINYQFDQTGELTCLDADSFVTRFERDAFGFELLRDLPGGIKSRWQRDATGRTLQHGVVLGEKQLHSWTYRWGKGHRLEKVIDQRGMETCFKHDDAGNLVAARYASGDYDQRIPDALQNLYQTESRRDREYNSSGQLLWKKDQNGITRFYYDDDGNRVAKSGANGQRWEYCWNLAGELTAVIKPSGDQVRFRYDALGRRVSKQTDNTITHWLWDGNVPLHEWTAGLADATAAGDQPDTVTWYFEPETFHLLGKKAGDHYYSVICNDLGTPLTLYDSKGECYWQAELDIWGRVLNQKGNRSDCPFRWPGMYEDEETGLYYNRFRYYDPDAGQYLSEDPLGLSAGLHFRNYVEDPLVSCDPLGLVNPNKTIGDIAEQAAQDFLEKNGSKVLGVVENKSGNGLDIITEEPGGHMRVYEVKANGSRLNKYQKKGPQSYAERQVDRAMGRGKRKFTHKTPASQKLAKRLDDYMAKNKVIQGCIIHVEVDTSSKQVKQITLKKWNKCP